MTTGINDRLAQWRKEMLEKIDKEVEARFVERQMEIERQEKQFDKLERAQKSTSELISVAVKSTLLINGGAAVAMLGFISSIANQNSPLKLDFEAAVHSLSWFGMGALFGGMCAASAYLASHSREVFLSSNLDTLYEVDSYSARARWWWGFLAPTSSSFAVLCAIGSLFDFGIGVFNLSDLVLND